MKKIFLVFSIIFGFTTLYGQTGSNYFNLICEIQPYEVDGVSQNAFEVKLTPIFSGQDYVCGINFQLQLKLYDANQIPLETLELTEDNNNVVIFQSSTDYGYKGDVISNLKYRYLITPDCNIINNIEFLKIAAQMETPLDYINGGNGCGYLWNINMIVTYPNSNWADQSGVSPPQNGTTNQININSDYISIGENFGVNTTSLNADICLVDLNSFIFGSACHFPDVIQVFPFGGCPPYMVQLMINNTTLDLLSIEDLPSNFYEQFDDGSGTLQDNFLLLPDPVPNLYLAQEGAVTYTVIVTDSKNNTFQQDYEIDNMLVISQDLTIMLVNENDLNCFDRYYMSVTSYGSEVSLSGENEPLPNGNIIYYPDSYYNAAANSIWFYRNGAYTVGIFNENCDTYFMSDEVTITNAIPVLEAENTVFCEGESISIHDNTDFVYFSYQWYKDGTPISGANTDNISITESGDYYLEVVKEADCPAWQTNILSFTFYENNTSVSPPQQICMGESVQLLASGGVSYSWSPGIGLNSTNVANPIAAPTETTVYEVTIIDDNACTFTQSVEIIVYDLPATGISANQSICAGESTQLEATGGATYAWSPSEGLNNATISNPTASPAVTTTYTVNIANDNCAVAEQVTITVHPTPTASAGTDQSICQGESTQLTATGGISYAWSPATGLDNPNIANPTASPTSTTTYTVSVTDENGCTDSDEVMITVLDVPQLTISGPTKNDCNCNYVILSMESNMP
ncbi:MAG: hypothetical protein KDD49_09165, partial [Bacteroidetes bacterium]|nr:hypothetical protein [Bacteroidota bacterium]